MGAKRNELTLEKKDARLLVEITNGVGYRKLSKKYKVSVGSIAMLQVRKEVLYLDSGLYLIPYIF
jgi:hypothetical protein